MELRYTCILDISVSISKAKLIYLNILFTYNNNNNIVTRAILTSQDIYFIINSSKIQ